MLVGRHQDVYDHENSCEDDDEGRDAECLDSQVDDPRMNDDMNHLSGIVNVIGSRRVKHVAYGENCGWEDARRNEMTFRWWGLWSWGCIRSHLAAQEQWGSCCT